jgi:hypothetical protein
MLVNDLLSVFSSDNLSIVVISTALASSATVQILLP